MPIDKQKLSAILAEQEQGFKCRLDARFARIEETRNRVMNGLRLLHQELKDIRRLLQEMRASLMGPTSNA